MFSIIPWLLLLLLVGITGFFMVQQHRDMQHALQEMELRMDEQFALLQEMGNTVEELAAPLEQEIYVPPSRMRTIDVRDLEEEDTLSIPADGVEEVDACIRELERHVDVSLEK